MDRLCSDEVDGTTQFDHRIDQSESPEALTGQIIVLQGSAVSDKSYNLECLDSTELSTHHAVST